MNLCIRIAETNLCIRIMLKRIYSYDYLLRNKFIRMSICNETNSIKLIFVSLYTHIRFFYQMKQIKLIRSEIWRRSLILTT